ncbi:MAG: hypothetical protein QM479_08195 [Pseudomonadota bacterium]
MRNLLLLIVLFSFSQIINASAPQQQQNPKLQLQSLIAEDTESVLLINNVSQFYNNLQKNPLAKLWNNKKIRKRFSSSIRTLKQPRWELYSKRMFGLSIKQLIALFPGQLVIIKPENSTAGSIALMADIGKNQQQVKDVLNKHMSYQLKHLGAGEQYLQEDETFLSFPIHSRYLLNEDSKKEDFSWAISSNYLLISKSKQQLQTMLVNIQKKNLDNNWTETGSYQNVKRFQPDFDWMFYINSTPFVELLNTKLEPYKEMAGQDSEQFLELLNNTGLQSLYIVGKNKQDKVLMDMSIFYQDNSWLMGLFKHQSSKLSWPEFLQENALSASISSINIGKIWNNILMLPEQSPIFAGVIPLIQMQLQVYSKSSGINLEDTLTEGFGQQFYSAFYPLPAPPSISTKNPEEISFDSINGNSLYVISLQDQQAIEMAINGLKKSFFLSELFKKKQYLDTSIHYYNPSNQKNIHQANDLVVYAIKDNLLLYSNNLAVMETAIEQLTNNNSKSSIKNLPQLQQIMAQLPEDAAAVSYYQGAYFVKGLIDALVAIQEMVIVTESKYSCETQSQAPTIKNTDKQQLQSETLKLYQGYLKDVFMTQHQSENYYRIHGHFNY